MPFLDNEDACATNSKIGYSPPSFFIIGIIEVVFSTTMAIIMFKRNCLPSLSNAQFVSYFLPFYLFIVIPLTLFCLIIGINSIVGIAVTEIYFVMVKWFLLRSFTETIAIFLLHAGIGVKSVQRSVFIGVTWTFLHLIVILFTFEIFGFSNMVLVALFILAELSVFYACLLFVPLRYFHRRPAIYVYATMSLIVVLYQIGSILAYVIDDGSQGSNCSITICFSFSEFLQIFVILYAFGDDSRFWQGLYVHSEVNLNEPLLGIWEMNREAVDMVTQSVFNLEKKVVPIIPFSHLRVDTSMYFSGGTARVYKGTYQKNEVAIKFLFCIELTPDRIVDFCNEATMLNSLQHPNIVKCYGVAIMPPAISLVTEFCHYGSLFDFLHSIEVNFPQERLTFQGLNRPRASTAQSAELGKSSTSLERFMASPISAADDEGDVLIPSRKANSNSLSYTDEESANNALLKYLDISAIDNIDAASKLADALANEYHANFSYRGSHSAHFSKPYPLAPQLHWTALSTSREAGSKSIKLQSPATVMLTREMGFGLGPVGSVVPSDSILKSPSLSKSKKSCKSHSRGKEEHQSQNGSYRSRSRLMSSGNTSLHSMGGILPFMIRLSMMRDCCAGLAFLHSKGIMHCDIKSLNFLVSSSLKVKLADLGEARMIQELDLQQKKLPSNINWSSPETLLINREVVTVNQSADVWSIGMVMYEILSGEIPFDTPEFRNMTMEVFLDELKTGERPTIPKEYSHISWLKALLESMGI